MQCLPKVNEFYNVINNIYKVLHGEAHVYASEVDKEFVNFLYRLPNEDFADLPILAHINESGDNLDDVMDLISQHGTMHEILSIVSNEQYFNVYKCNCKKYNNKDGLYVFDLNSETILEFSKFIGRCSDIVNINNAIVAIYGYIDTLEKLFNTMSGKEKDQTVSLIYYGMIPFGYIKYKSCLVAAKTGLRQISSYDFSDNYYLAETFAEGYIRRGGN